MLQTGVHATVSGCFRNGLALREDETTLARCFVEGGYRAGYIGKWHLAGEEPVTESRRAGYQDWLGANAIELVSDAYRCDVFDGENRPVRLAGYRVDALTDAAIRYVDDHRDRPFFLFFSLLRTSRTIATSSRHPTGTTSAISLRGPRPTWPACPGAPRSSCPATTGW